jgi:hypothetical protein
MSRAMKDITKMDLDEWCDYATGHILVEIGKGERFRTLIGWLVIMTLNWQDAQRREQEKKEKLNGKS